MSDSQLSEETKVKLVEYTAELLKTETGKKRPYNDAFQKAMNKKEGFQSDKTKDLIDNQTEIMLKQIDNLAELLGASEQKTSQINNQLQTFRLANLILIFVYYGVLVGVKGLMLMQYLKTDVQHNEWVDTIVLTLLFVYPYIVYPIESWIYEFITWVFGLVYNTTKIPDITSTVTSTDAYAPPVDLDSKFQPIA